MEYQEQLALPRQPLAGARLLVGSIVLAALYFLTARLGLLLAIEPGSSSPVWPPTGLAIAALWIYGRRLAPAIFVGELLAVLFDGLPPGVAMGMGLGNAAEALLAVSLIERLAFREPLLGRARDLSLYLAVTILVATPVGATVGVLSLASGGVLPSGLIPLAWATWWLGDAAGAAVVAPLLVAWLRPAGPLWPKEWRSVLLVFLAGLLLSHTVFTSWLPLDGENYPLVFLLLPVLVWGAFELPSRWLTLLIVLLSAIAVIGTANDHGPFVREDPTLSLLLLQSYMGVITATSLMLRAVLLERAEVRAELERHQEELQGRVDDALHSLRLINRELEEDRSYMAVVQDTLPTLLLVLDGEGCILTFNRACQALTGYRPEEVLGRPAIDLFVPAETQADAGEVFAALRSQEGGNLFENDWLTQSGERRRIEWHNTAVRDSDGTLQYVVAIGLDITARRQAEAALRKATAEWSAAMDSFDDAVCITDGGGWLLRANQTFWRMTEWDRERALGQPLVDLLVPATANAETNPLARLLETRREGQLTLPAGDPHNPLSVPVEVTVGVMGEAGGAVDGLVVALHDLTHFQEAEVELERLGTHMRLLLESTDEGIYGMDAHGRCTFVNHAAAELLGYSPAEMVGADMHTLIHHSREDGCPLPAGECPIHQTLHSGRSVRVNDEVLWHRDGHSIPVHYSANPILEHGRVTGAVVVFRNVAEEREMARRMDYLASHDALTGLFNRFIFERHLKQAITNAQLEASEHVLCYLDLDQFKVVNDTCGHIAGDELLRQLAPLLQRRIRQGDIIARLGGDEFGILLLSCTTERALPVVETLRKAVQEYRFAWEGKTFSVGVSVGVFPINRETPSLASALSAADSACYMAKERGRNRVHLYQEADAELARRHGEMQWVARIHAALDEERLLLHAQPIIPVHAPSRGHHLEILVRLVDEKGEIIPPGAFIPAAERYNLMSGIDRWVITETFRWLHAHPEHLAELDICAINLSGQTIGESGIMEAIIEQARALGIPPRRICFEITETAAVANLSTASRFISELKSHGFLFALDDFGSGMSSFAYLRSLPVDFLKIDGNFVRDIAHDRTDHAMVAAINRVGQVMGLQTIGEFVENDAILGYLRQLGVDYAQGYGVGRPMPLEELFGDAPRDGQLACPAAPAA